MTTTPGYRRSAGSRRGEARKQELLELVTEDLAVNGLVDFSLRRAARAAGTTHKVLLYHFDGAEDLLRQAVFRLRQRRIDNALAVLGTAGGGLVAFVRTVWPTLVAEESGLRRVLDQAMGLSMYDTDRYRDLGREASGQYMPLLMAACPQAWSDERKRGMAALVLATLRGFLLERLVGDPAGVDAGFEELIATLELVEG